MPWWILSFWEPLENMTFQFKFPNSMSNLILSSPPIHDCYSKNINGKNIGFWSRNQWLAKSSVEKVVCLSSICPFAIRIFSALHLNLEKSFKASHDRLKTSVLQTWVNKVQPNHYVLIVSHNNSALVQIDSLSIRFKCNLQGSK